LRDGNWQILHAVFLRSGTYHNAYTVLRNLPKYGVILLCLYFPLLSIAASGPFKSDVDNQLYRLAEQHDPAAQYMVGRKYYTGIDVKKDIYEAIKWFELAATQKYTKAQFQLGIIYLYGESGIKSNPVYALNYLRDAAQNRYAEAQFELANYYLTGKTDNVNYPEAVKWYRAAAEQKHVKAMVELGKILNEGRGGITPQIDEAKRLLSEAAESGNSEAIQYLRNMPQHGLVAAHNPASVNVFQAKLDDASAGHIPSQYEVGMAYLKGIGVESDMKQAAKWLRRAAMNDHSEAQYQLSQLYRDGVGIEKNPRRALEWLKIAASAGVRDAQKELRSMHLSGSSLEEIGLFMPLAEETEPSQQSATKRDSSTDLAKTETQSATTDESLEGLALSVVTPPAPSESGTKQRNSSSSTIEIESDLFSLELDPIDPEKQYRLAKRYETGKDLFKDTARAAYWLEQAARQGHLQAQYELGEMYKKGNGVTASLAKAKFWLSSAAAGGMQEAKTSLRDLEGIPLPEDSNVVKTHMSLPSVPATATPSNNHHNTVSQDPAKPKTKDNTATLTSAGMVNTLGRSDPTQNGIEPELKRLMDAADNNNPNAQLKLAEMYQKGSGVNRDLMLSIQWYQKAAAGGEAEAQFQLGDMYKQGQGVEKNNALAIKWFRKAANQGHAEAKRRLGGCRIC